MIFFCSLLIKTEKKGENIQISEKKIDFFLGSIKGIKTWVKNLTLASGIPEWTVPLKTLLEAIEALRKAIRERAEGIEDGSIGEELAYCGDNDYDFDLSYRDRMEQRRPTIQGPARQTGILLCHSSFRKKLREIMAQSFINY